MRRYLSKFKNYFEHQYIKIVASSSQIRNTHSNIHAIKKILVIRLDEIGDMVLTTPFLRELRRNFPKSEITLVVKPETYNLFELCPYIDQLKSFKRKSGRWGVFRNLNLAKAFVNQELNDDYDLAIVPRFDSDFAYMAGAIAFYSGATRRVGYAPWVLPHKSKTDAGMEGFYTDFVPAKKGVRHELERNLDILRYLGCNIESDALELWIDEHDKEIAMRLLSTKERYKLLVLVLSAGAKHKEWPLQNYIDMVDFFRKENILPVLVGARENTKNYSDEFCKAYPETINLVGKCTLRETYAVMKQCELFLGGDTGPMHMAVASGIAGVVMFFTHWKPEYIDTPERFGPWKGHIQVVQPNISKNTHNTHIMPYEVTEKLVQ